jgi:hypothetical protein
MWVYAPPSGRVVLHRRGFHDREDFLPAERVPRSCLAGSWSPAWACPLRRGRLAPGRGRVTCPVHPRGLLPFGQAGVFVEFTGLVAFLVHDSAPDPPLSPDPPPRWERCDGTGQRDRRQHWSNATVSGEG